MRTFLKFTLALIIGCIAMVSCEDKADDPFVIAQQRLQHSWLVDSTTLITVTTSSVDTLITKGTITDYVDFRTDSNVYSKFGMNQADTAAYTFLNDSHIKIDADTFTLKKLTINRLIYNIKRQTSATNYNVLTRYLRR